MDAPTPIAAANENRQGARPAAFVPIVGEVRGDGRVRLYVPGPPFPNDPREA